MAQSACIMSLNARNFEVYEQVHCSAQLQRLTKRLNVYQTYKTIKTESDNGACEAVMRRLVCA